MASRCGVLEVARSKRSANRSPVVLYTLEVGTIILVDRTARLVSLWSWGTERARESTPGLESCQPEAIGFAAISGGEEPAKRCCRYAWLDEVAASGFLSSWASIARNPSFRMSFLRRHSCDFLNPFFDLAFDLSQNAGMTGVLFKGPPIVTRLKRNVGVLAEQPQETKYLRGLLLRQHVDLQVEVIAPLTEPRLAVLTDHEDRRGIGRLN